MTGKATVRVTVKRPGGKAAAGLAVVLVAKRHGETLERRTARTDALGRAVFAAVPRGEHIQHAVLTPYEGVNYSTPVELREGVTEVAVEVAPVTRSAAALRISRLHLILDPGRDRVHVTEVIAIVNPGKSTYAGEPLRIPLFRGAQHLRAQGGEAVYALDPDVLRYRGYLRPGRTDLQFEYHVPLTGTLERRTELAIERLFVIVTRPSAELRGAVLRSVKTMTRGDLTFLSAEGGPVAAAGKIAFELAPGAEPVARAGEAGSPASPRGEAGLVRDWRVVAQWLAPLAALIVFFFGVTLAARREPEEGAEAGEAALRAERARLLDELASQPGTRRAAELTARLARIYRLLDRQAVVPSSRG